MKPYQIKLRIVGVLSIILAVLAASIPLPSRAASVAELDDIRSKYTYSVETDENDNTKHTVWLTRYLNSGVADDATWELPAEFSLGVNTYYVRFASDSVFLNCDHLTSIEIDEAVFSEVSSVKEMFKGCTNLTTVTIKPADQADGIDTTSITNMEAMFEGCSSLTAVDIDALDMENVTTMERMFAGCESLTTFTAAEWDGDLAKVETMECMFENCPKLEEADLANLGVGALWIVRNMFSGDAALTKVSFANVRFNTIGGTAYASGMFDGCKGLKTLITPTGLPSASHIYFPYEYVYRDASDNTYTELPPARSESIEITRIDDVTGIVITPDDLSAAQELTEGTSTTLTVALTPAFTPDKEVTVTSADTGIATVSPAAGTVDEDGNLTVTVTAVKANVDAYGNPQPTTVTVTAKSDKEETITAECEITVVAAVTPVTGIALTPDTARTIYIGETLDLTAAISPEVATNHHVTWISGNSSVASVTNTATGENSGTGTGKDTPSKTTVTGVTPGVSLITAKSNNGDYTASLQVTVLSPYDIYTNTSKDKNAEATTDERSDCSNTKYTSVSADYKPVSGDLLLHIKGGGTTPANDAFATQMTRTGTDYNKISYFTLDYTKDDGSAVTDDLGNLYISLALPGSMQPPNSTGQQLHLYSYNDGATTPNNLAGDIVRRISYIDGRVDGVTIKVKSADIVNGQEYAFAMNTDTTPAAVDYDLEAADKRSQRATASIAHPATDISGAKTTYQESDIYLHVEDSQNESWKAYVAGLDEFKNYTKYYYDLHPSRQSNEEVAVGYDFKEIRVFLSLPDDSLDLMKDNIILIREDHNYTGAGYKYETVKYDNAMGLDNGYQYMAFNAGPDDFSEYTILVPTDGTKNDDGPHTYTGDGITINVSIPEINITIDGSGNVVSGSTGGTGSDGGGTGSNPVNPANPADQQTGNGSTFIYNNYYGGTIPGNAGDMPTTGGAHMYRALIVILLALSGIVEVMLSIPARRRLRSN